MAHRLQGAAAQPSRHRGHGASVRPGADAPRWRAALSAAQQPEGEHYRPEAHQPQATDVPGSNNATLLHNTVYEMKGNAFILSLGMCIFSTISEIVSMYRKTIYLSAKRLFAMEFN